jgi:hypothetical protein
MAALAHQDFETRSAADLKKVGVYRYAEDPSTEGAGAVLALRRRAGAALGQG